MLDHYLGQTLGCRLTSPIALQFATASQVIGTAPAWTMRRAAIANHPR